MTISDWVFFAVVAVLATNHVLVRLPGWERRTALFWCVQALNIACASWMLAVGLPDFEGNLAVFNWVVGLLFIVRAVQNNGRWSEARQQARSVTEDDETKARIRAALRAADAHEE
ncbi:MAG: hypothetical protein CL927_08555 [Deltaproteobacteria bacterium]|nr:hypothetical protein [Deltaproteobacteria bacterium]